jgi:hypothetical protein
VALLALYSVYGVWTAITEHSLLSALTGAVALVACVGIARLKAWSRFLVYVLTAAFIGTWGYSVYDAFNAGYFSLVTPREIVLSLFPEIVLVVLWCLCTYFVFRQFRASPRRT